MIQSTSNASNGAGADIETSARIQSDSQNGVIGSWWQLGIGMSESTATFGFGLAQDIRGELRRRTDVVIGFAEDMTVGTFSFARKLVDRIDRVAGEALGRSEAATRVVTRTLRKTGHGVTELASSTLSDTIGSAQSPAQPRGDGRATASA
jgi:hypothetical protein